MSRFSLLIVSLFLLNSCGITPSHDIKPKPEHIKAGVQVGDKIEIVTKDGEEIDMVVTDVSASALESENRRVLFLEIEKLTKRSWSEPGHPCGAGEPVGCSVPQVLLVLSSDLENQIDKFRKPCVTHDFCYRHGSATYGLKRSDCDTTFYDDMRAACNGGGVLDMFDPKDLALCELSANRTYEAVRTYGDDAFRTTTSTYCEYL